MPKAKKSTHKAVVSKPWSANSQDGLELKAYVELGFCQGFNAAQLCNKYPQFNAYCNKTLYNTLYRLRNNATSIAENRKNMKKDGCKSYNLFFYFISLLKYIIHEKYDYINLV